MVIVLAVFGGSGARAASRLTLRESTGLLKVVRPTGTIILR